MLTYFMLLPGLYFVFADIDRIQVDAETAVAVLEVQQAGRSLVRLPDIGFRLGIAAYCANGGQPQSMSITIADTRRTLPARQIAPLALQEFCVDPASEGDSVLVTSALAVQASLRCSRGEDQSIVFAAEPLDIRVDCIRASY